MLKEPHKKQALFKDLTVGSYIRKRLSKGVNMLMIHSIDGDNAKVKLWQGSKPLKKTFPVTKSQIDYGDYIFIQKVEQGRMLGT